MKEDLKFLQKKIYRYMRRKANALEGEWSTELKRYRNSQRELCKRRVKKSDFKELISSINSSDVIYLGDFHTFDQSIKNLERILRNLSRNGRKALGVEFVQSAHQDCIDAFLKGHITELEFLECIDYGESWRFPWSHYKVIFDLAKRYKFEVIALNNHGTLYERDVHAAELIYKYLEQYEDAKIMVLFGEYHIVNDKLPQRVKEVLPKHQSTIIHQNLDELYWRQLGKLKGEIYKFGPREFTLQTSPPWVKYESMIYWFENLSEDPEFDIHQYIMENKIKTFSSNAEENFLQLSKYIADSLGVEIERDEIEDFNLYDHRKLEFINKRIEQNKKLRVIQFYRKLIKNGKSFKLPYSTNFYCSNYSINRMSFLAGTHIHSIVMKKLDPNFETILFKGPQDEKFYFFFFQSLFAYFSSKIINPYRKCDLYCDVVQRHKAAQTHPQKRKNLGLALELIDTPEEIDNLLRGNSLRGMHSSAKTLGNMVADYIFEEFYKKESAKMEKIFPKLFIPSPKFEDFHYFVSEFMQKKKFKKRKKRVF